MKLTRSRGVFSLLLVGGLAFACVFVGLKRSDILSDSIIASLKLSKRTGGSTNDDTYWRKNFIKGGEWPELLLSERTVPIYGSYSFPARHLKCEECLDKVQRFDSKSVTYLCPAKAGSRTVRDSLCGCCSGLHNDTVVDIHSCQQHHCHRCSIRQLEEHGATKIIVPVREPKARLLSLVKYQWDDFYSKKPLGEDVVSPEKFLETYNDPSRHDELIKFLSMAWQSYDYYFYNSTGRADLQFVCVNKAMVAQYNYGIKRMVEEAPEELLIVSDGSKNENQYEGQHVPGYNGGRHRKLREERNNDTKSVFPEISLEQELWNKYCL